MGSYYEWGLIMIATNTLQVACENPTLHEIHRSKISLHHAKADYSYPTIRLPHTLTKLAGLSTHIYQTMHDGALAFLVVVSPLDSVSENAAESSRPSPLHGEGRAFESPSAKAALIARVGVLNFRDSRNPSLF